MSDSARGLVGLSNQGNTCYMNAALQCLLNNPALCEFFLTCPSLVLKASRPVPLARAFRKLVDDAHSQRCGDHLAPVSVRYALIQANPMFRGYQQHDSQEFLRCFMDLLHEELMQPIETEDGLGEGEEESDAEEPLRQGQATSQSRLGSETTSPVSSDAEPEEYETADSGVSDQSSNEEEARGAGLEAGAGASPRRKRMRAREMAGDSAMTKQRDLEGAEADNESGLGSASTRSRLSAHHSASSLGQGTSSDAEMDFTDALSSISGSPPLSESPRPFGRSPAKVVATTPPLIQKRTPKVYRSVISDIFDGKLVSSVKCLTCDRISSTTETFQDLSLPIPMADTLAAIRSQTQQEQLQDAPASSSSAGSGGGGAGGGWLSWAWEWLSGWLYGPNITLVDCLSYFFSADELKGDNMYSCERCKKLRNGLKFAKVTVLPDTLCIHLKRFRHDFAFSSKVSTRVTFPLVDLDMSPWLHKDSKSSVCLYDLMGVICHHGGAGGGHYTAYALNPYDQEWYEFDDASVSRVEHAAVANAEAYVLFYRKNSTQMEPVREMASCILTRPSLVQFYVSKQWLNKFENFAEPGPIDNSDFLCRHGGVLPTKSAFASELCVALPQPAWDLLRGRFGGGLACTVLRECPHCRAELDALNRQKTYELEEFKALHAEFQEAAAAAAAASTGGGARAQQPVYCLSTSWFRSWEKFVTDRVRDPPGPIDNHAIVTSKQQPGSPVAAAATNSGEQQAPQMTLRQNSDFVQLSHDIWLLLHSIYGGGPEVLVRANGSIYVGPAGGGGGGPGRSGGRHLPAIAAKIRSRTASESVALDAAASADGSTSPPGRNSNAKNLSGSGMTTRSKTMSACEVK